jgi:AraC-like DNA-binding protein
MSTPESFSPDDLALAEKTKQLLLSGVPNFPTTAQLGEQLGTPPATLKIVFQQVYGAPIRAVRQRMLMEYARRLLGDTDHSLDEIALLSGYHSQSAFTTAFRLHFGVTPGSVRRTAQR